MALASAADALSQQMTSLKERMDKYRINSAQANAHSDMTITPELLDELLKTLTRGGARPNGLAENLNTALAAVASGKR